MYMAVSHDIDRLNLQLDLQALADWELKWQMEFHPAKCQVIHVSRKHHVVENKYYLHGQRLESVKEAKYLGVTITSDMRWNTHIDNITNKANQTLGFLKRNLRVSSPTIKATAYKTLVRPLLEYSSTVWDPHTRENVNKVEAVQRRAARYCANNYQKTAGVSAMIRQLNWTSLENRRTIARLAMMYKIVNGLVAIPKDVYLTPIQHNFGTRHTNNFNYEVPRAIRDYYKSSFFPKTIPQWNSLPQQAVSAPSLEAFKHQVTKHFPA